MAHRRSNSVEGRALLIVQKALGRRVEVNDDGSAQAQYDLRIGPADNPKIAIECVGAVNPGFTELWNIGPAKGPWHLSVRGDWIVFISQQASIRSLRASLENLLQQLEARGIESARIQGSASFDEMLSARMRRLCITRVDSYRPIGTGQVHLGLPGVGGAVDEHGTDVPEWIGAFLRHPDRADVLTTLKRSRAPQCHAFVIATLHGTPWPVTSYLSRRLIHVPAERPDLPHPLTGVWIIADVGEDALYWDGDGWRIVNAIPETP